MGVGSAVIRPAAQDDGASWLHFALWAGSVVVLLGLFFVPAVAPALLRAEHWAADWRTAFLSDRLQGKHPTVAIISIEEESVSAFPYILPINRGYLADLVTATDRAGALAIGLDFYFTRSTEAIYDAKLLDALQQAKAKIVVGVYEDPRRPAQLAYQKAFIVGSHAQGGYIDLHPDPDYIVRYRTRAPDNASFSESFSSLLARSAGWTGSTAPDRIAWLLPPRDGGRTFSKMEAHDFLAASAEQRAAMVKGRVVLIGDNLFSLDLHNTPLTIRSRQKMSGVDIHAQMAAELIDGHRSYAELGPTQARVFVALLACLGIALGARFPRRGFDFLDWRVVSLLVIALDLVFFRLLHLMLPFTLATVAWISGVTAGRQTRRALAWSRARRGAA
jgi:CHASE2 domain-containing sensor protein